MALNKTENQGIFPVWAKDGEDITGTFSRYSSLPTPDLLKSRALFGIPLTSALTIT